MGLSRSFLDSPVFPMGDLSHPVCGTDGVTYSSACDLQMSNCGLEVSVQYSGSCHVPRRKNRRVKKRAKRSVRLCGRQFPAILDTACGGRFNPHGGIVTPRKCCAEGCTRTELRTFCRT